jgi:hypothetical protein
MGTKVTFDPATRIIQVDTVPVLDGSDYVVDINVEADLYSDGKEDWKTDADLNRLKFAFKSAGGDQTPDGYLGSTFFLENNWKIRPYEGDHWFRIDGNLFSRDGSNPFIKTVGAYNVAITQKVSEIVTVLESGTSGLTVSESTKLTNIDTISTYQMKILDNRRLLVKVGSTWHLRVFDDNGITVIQDKELKDASGNDISDIAAGTLAQELKNSV